MSQDQQQTISKLHIAQNRLQASQFVFQLDPRTLLPIEIAAPACGKSSSTFRSDLLRRPQSLPPVVRSHGRVHVRVKDLLDWIEGASAVPVSDAPALKRGRPTKAMQLARANRVGVNHG